MAMRTPRNSRPESRLTPREAAAIARLEEQQRQICRELARLLVDCARVQDGLGRLRQTETAEDAWLRRQLATLNVEWPEQTEDE